MFFLGIDISNILLFLKILGFIVSLGLLVGIVISWLGIQDVQAENAKKEFEHFNIYDDFDERGDTPQDTQWQAITSRFQSPNPNDWKMAIIDADTLLEDLITQLGYQGESFGEKLKSISVNDFPRLDDAWYVHKLRNKLAHEGSMFHLSEREAYQAYHIYNDIFHSTGYIS